MQPGIITIMKIITIDLKQERVAIKANIELVLTEVNKNLLPATENS